MGDVRLAVCLVAFAALASACELITNIPPQAAESGGGGQGGSTTTSSTASNTGGHSNVECYLPLDCPGEDTDCTVRTCEEGRCGLADVPSGTPTKNQVAGDCQRAVCDGGGKEVVIVDTDDIPIDADPCTDDVCTANLASNPPSSAGKPCDVDGGSVCDGLGECVACVAAADCPLGLACVDNVCM